MMGRSLNKAKGIAAEKRIMEVLRRQPDTTRVERVSDLNNLTGPDIIWVTRREQFVVEAKSIMAFSKNKLGQMRTGRIRISKVVWESMLQWQGGWTPILVIEINVQGRRKLYYQVSQEHVQPTMDKKNEALTVWQIIDWGERLYV